VDFGSHLGFNEETATFDPLTACLVLVDEEQRCVADFEAVFQSCTFEVVVYESWRATYTPQSEPAYHELGLIREVKGDKLVWLHSLG
jgi:hypothetical protein